MGQRLDAGLRRHDGISSAQSSFIAFYRLQACSVGSINFHALKVAA
jgi:hypothetical protein